MAPSRCHCASVGVRLGAPKWPQGVAHTDEIADAYCGPERAATGRRSLRVNLKYRFGAREAEGLQLYYDLVAKHGLVQDTGTVPFFPQ